MKRITLAFIVVVTSTLSPQIHAAYSVCVPALGNVIYVDASNSENEDGSEDYPWNTIQEGIDDAVSGQCIWVKEGTYSGQITLDSGISLYGGFPFDSFSWDDRDPQANETIIQGINNQYWVVYITSEQWVVFDGFIIDTYDFNYQNGIYVNSSEDIVIGTNKIKKADENLGKNAIDISASTNVSVSGNEIVADISGDNKGWLNGIFMFDGDGTWIIESNKVANCNTLATSCGIITSSMTSDGDVINNTVTDSSIGITCIKEGNETAIVKVTNNRIRACDYGIKQRYSGNTTQMSNVIYNWIYQCKTRGIELEFPAVVESNGIWECHVGIEDKHASGTVTIEENSIYKCESYGIYVNSTATTNLYNNISYDNDYGIKGTLTGTNADYNCVYASETDNYDPNGFQGANDLVASPVFRAPPFAYVWDQHWRFFLQQNPPQSNPPYSPCKNAGNSKPPYGTTRSDYVADSGIIDIGARLMTN